MALSHTTIPDDVEPTQTAFGSLVVAWSLVVLLLALLLSGDRSASLAWLS